MSEVQKYEQDKQGRWPLILHPQMLADLKALPDWTDEFPYMLSSVAAPSSEPVL